MKKRRIALAIVMAGLAVLASASSWEGSAMMGSYGDFPASGYYAACNSFARNTSVEVVNLENGKSVTVIVTRGLENSGVFMMLSVEAASAIGLQPGRVARIRASEPRSAVELAPAAGRSSSFDPDLNPRLIAAEELKRLGYELTPTGSVPVAAAPATVPATVPAPAVAAIPKETPAIAPVAPAAAAVKPSALGLEAPAAVAPRAAPVSVAEPTAVEGARPEPVAAAKLKPVRTVMLPQLPEPTMPVAKTPAAVTPVPEAFASVMPVPDETPIRVGPTTTPKRYEAPALRPDAFQAGLAAPAPSGVAVVLAEPSTLSDARAVAYARSAPGQIAASATADLADPSEPSSGRASAVDRLAPGYAAGTGEFQLSDPELKAAGKVDALARTVPGMAPSGAGPELAWPEIEADELPDVALAKLVAPPETIPATSLAEGEMILPSTDGPSALAIETPAFGAAETMVALEEAEVSPGETPVAVSPESRAPLDSKDGAELAEATEQKPETTPYVEPPLEYVVKIEPTAPKPPVSAPATGPATAAPVTAVPPTVAPPAVKPAVTAAPPTAAPVGALQKGLYYIQIGAFRNESAAKDASSRVGSSFSVLIEKIGDRGKETWRVYVGPLTRDESGVALVRVRSMGYKDAFVKSGG